MLNKEQYLHLRNSGQIDLNLAWEYYNEVEHHVAKLPYQHFIQLFQMWLGMGAATMEHFNRHYDVKFGVNKLTFKDNNFKYV